MELSSDLAMKNWEISLALSSVSELNNWQRSLEQSSVLYLYSLQRRFAVNLGFEKNSLRRSVMNLRLELNSLKRSSVHCLQFGSKSNYCETQKRFQNNPFENDYSPEYLSRIEQSHYTISSTEKKI